MGKTSTSSQNTQPWEAAVPYLKGNMDVASKLFGMGGTGPDPYNNAYPMTIPKPPEDWQSAEGGALTDYLQVIGAVPPGGGTGVQPPMTTSGGGTGAVGSPIRTGAPPVAGQDNVTNAPPPDARQDPGMVGGTPVPTPTVQKTVADYAAKWGNELPPEGIRATLVANAPRYFPGDIVQDFDPLQSKGIAMGANRAMQGSPLNTAAQQGLLGTIQGDFLDPAKNPYLDATYNKAANAVSGRVGSEMAKLGRLGGGAHTDILSQNLGNLATDIYGKNYEQERARQYGAYGLAPTLAAEDYKDVQMLMDLGGMSQDQAQREVLAQKERFDYYQTLPFRQLADLTTMMNPNAGFGSTSMGQQGASGLAGLLGITGAMRTLFG